MSKVEKLTPELLFKFYSIKEVSKILGGLHPERVRSKMKSGEIPNSFIMGGKRGVMGYDLYPWIEAKKAKSPEYQASLTLLDLGDPKNLRGVENMRSKVKKSGKDRWAVGGFGGFCRKQVNGFTRWYGWVRSTKDGKYWRRPVNLPIVQNLEEAKIAFAYVINEERKKEFYRMYAPEQAEELGYFEEKGNGQIATVKKMLEDWLNLYSKPNRKGHSNDKSVVKYWTERFGKKKAGELTQGDVMRHFAKEINDAMDNGKNKEELEKMKNTQKQKGQVLRAVYNWAKKMGDYGVKENPVEGTLPKVYPKEKEPFIAEERKVLFEKAGEFHPHMKPVQSCAAVYGARKEEIGKLNWTEVDLEEGEIKILDPKEKKPKTLYFDRTTYTYGMLKEMKKTHDRIDKGDFMKGAEEAVFIYWNPRYKKWGRVPIGLHFGEIMKLAGLNGNGKSFHSWRHTAGSEILNAVVNKREIQKMYGHHSPKMTDHYLHADKEAQINVVKIIEKQLNIRELNGSPLTLQR